MLAAEELSDVSNGIPYGSHGVPSAELRPATDHSWSYFYLVCASVLWGSTNPLIRRASRRKQPEVVCPLRRSRTLASCLRIDEGLRFVKDWQLSLPLAVNQLGSIFFLTGLADCKLSFAVPFVNSMTFVITSITGFCIGEFLSVRQCLGMVSIIIGIIFCTQDVL